MPFKENSAINYAETKPNNDKKPPVSEAEGFALKFSDLVPYRADLEKYIQNHVADFASFLEYRNAPYKLVCGDGFYHRPKDNTICLSVPYYKECMDGGMSIEQFLFICFHEFAHLKAMMERDRAGKHNELAQMTEYEAKKTIRDNDDPKKFVNLQPTYRHFYNILEDAMVNHLVLKTRHYSSVTNKKNNQEIADSYLNKFFALYKSVGEGAGDYVKDKEAESGFKFVGEGAGDYVILQKSDYDTGFDFANVEPEMKRSGQFVTYFIKNQMCGLKTCDIASEDNPDGKFKMDEDVNIAFNKPLVEAYPELLKRILSKYKDDPKQKKRYLEFMGQVISTPSYKEEKGKIVKDEPVLTENVFLRPRREVNGREVDVYAEKGYDLDETELSTLLNSARFQFSRKMEEVGRQMGISNYRKLTYLDLFNKFKETTRAKSYSLTDPLKYNLQERTLIMRKTLEPIFTMLCILDNSFDISAPSGEPAPGENGEPGNPGKPENNPEQSVWQPGQKVRNVDPKSINNGKVGTIMSVNPGADGSVKSVVIEYFDDANKMAGGVGYAAVSEEVFDPAKNLKIITKKGSESGGKVKKEKVQYEYEDEDDEDKKDKEKNEEDPASDEDTDEEKENGDEDEGEDESEEGGSPSNEEPSADESKENGKPADAESSGEAKKKEKLIKEMNDTIKALKEAIEADDRKANVEEAIEAKRSQDYQDKDAENKRQENLREKLRAERARRGETEPHDSDFSDQEVVAIYRELEKEVAPYADEMAKAWLDIVKNISREIQIAKEKYFISGKMNMKKVQRIFPLMEAGKKIDEAMVFERWVEKIFMEVRPRMLRLMLLVDNSGSMSSNINSIRIAVLLLNKSLASLKNLFQLEMKRVLGSSASQTALDFVTDTEIFTFNYANNHQLIKEFGVTDLSFLDNPEKATPRQDASKEEIATLRVFQQLRCSGATYDGGLWQDIYRAHDNPDLVKKIKDGKLTEVIFQISDGDIADEEVALPIIKLIKKDFNIPTGGMAISEKGDLEALKALKKRHGENVRSANNAEEIAKEFKEFLKQLIKDQIEKPMVEYVKNSME